MPVSLADHKPQDGRQEKIGNNDSNSNSNYYSYYNYYYSYSNNGTYSYNRKVT